MLYTDEDLHLCTFKTPISWAVVSERGDADCAFQTRNGVKWDNPPMEGCLLIHLSVTLPLNLYNTKFIVAPFLREHIALFFSFSADTFRDSYPYVDTHPSPNDRVANFHNHISQKTTFDIPAAHSS